MPYLAATRTVHPGHGLKRARTGPPCVRKSPAHRYVLKFYKDDEVLCEEFVKFCESESLACDEAELGPDKLKVQQPRHVDDDD